jgi:thermostable 8-oxoguanine DNA glycosylase
MTNQAIAETIFEKVFANVIPTAKTSFEEATAQAKMLYELFRYDKVKEIREVLESAGNTRAISHDG